MNKNLDINIQGTTVTEIIEGFRKADNSNDILWSIISNKSGVDCRDTNMENLKNIEESLLWGKHTKVKSPDPDPYTMLALSLLVGECIINEVGNVVWCVEDETDMYSVRLGFVPEKGTDMNPVVFDLYMKCSKFWYDCYMIHQLAEEGFNVKKKFHPFNTTMLSHTVISCKFAKQFDWSNEEYLNKITDKEGFINLYTGAKLQSIKRDERRTQK